MNVYFPDEDWNDQYDSPEEFAGMHAKKEGDEFELIQANVTAKTTYRIVDGRPFCVALSFADGFERAGERNA